MIYWLESLYSIILPISLKKTSNNSGFKISIFLFASFKFVSCSRNETEVISDFVYVEPLSVNVTEWFDLTYKPSGCIKFCLESLITFVS